MSKEADDAIQRLVDFVNALANGEDIYFAPELRKLAAAAVERKRNREAEEAQLGFAELLKEYARFRAAVRWALWDFWPSNVGVSDDEIIDAVRRVVALKTSPVAFSSNPSATATASVWDASFHQVIGGRE